MKLPIRQILRGKAGGEGGCCGDCCFKKPSVFGNRHLLTCCTLRLGTSGRGSPGLRALPDRVLPAAVSHAARASATGRGLLDRRTRPFKDWAGARAGPTRAERRSHEPMVRGRDAGTAQSKSPARSAFSEALAFPRNHFCESWRPIEPFFSLYPGGGAGGGCPKEGLGDWGVLPGSRRLVVRTVHSCGVAKVPGRPCLKHVSGGCPGSHLPGLGLQSKGRSQSCVVDDS